MGANDGLDHAPLCDVASLARFFIANIHDRADRILVLDKGKIVEDGKYEELIARGGFFAELVARQRLDTEPQTPRAER